MKKQIIHWLGLGVLMFWLLAGQTVLAAAAQQPGWYWLSSDDNYSK